MWYHNTITARGKPFEKGRSANPAGRPKGARSRRSLTLDAISEGEAEAIARKAIELALGGDTVALRLCLDRIAPPRQDQPVAFALPRLLMPSDAAEAMVAIDAAVAAGDFTPREAPDLSRLVVDFARTLEVDELHERLARLEGDAT